jgi:hypothetical protein
LIQVFTRTRNTDPKVRTSRFVSFKFKFHSSAAATFATLSANNRHSRAHSKTLSARVRIGSVILRPICASALSA